MSQRQNKINLECSTKTQLHKYQTHVFSCNTIKETRAHFQLEKL